MRRTAPIFCWARSMVLFSAASLADEVVLRSTASLVVVDVAVLDRHGNPVRNLKREQFSVSEDGAKQTIKQFSATDTPASIGFVVDLSGSMAGKAASVYSATSALMDASGDEDEYFVVGFNDTAKPALPPGRDFSRNRDEVKAAVRSIRTQGRTALFDALSLSLRHGARSTYERRVLVLVSDGKDNGSALGLKDVLELVRASQTTIYTIGLYEAGDADTDTNLLKRLSRISGGKFYHPEQPAELEKACVEIAKEIRGRYTLAYTPPEDLRPGLVHKIRIAVERHAGESNVNVRARSERVGIFPDVERNGRDAKAKD